MCGRIRATACAARAGSRCPAGTRGPQPQIGSVAGVLLAGVHVESLSGALLGAALIGVLNALLPPIVAALRLPFTLVLGFFAVLAVDAGILLLVSDIASADFKVDSFGLALLASLVMSAASMGGIAVL